MRSHVAFVVAPLLGLIACRSEQTPSTPAAATAPAAEPAPEPDVIITETTADPDKMPSDAIHMGLRRGDTVGRVGPHMTPRGPMQATPQPAEEGVALPLPLGGSGSVAELEKRKAVAPPGRRDLIEEAFRKLFTVERQNRDGARAKVILEQLALDEDPKVKATALRLLGFVAINSGFDEVTAQARYEAALELDPDYGECHYALAFTLGPRDPKTGRAHYDRAMALGVPDSRNLKDQFYKD